MPRPAIGPRAMTPAERQARRREQFREMQRELKRLRRFVQYVADYSNYPQVVREAKAHGAH